MQVKYEYGKDSYNAIDFFGSASNSYAQDSTESNEDAETDSLGPENAPRVLRIASKIRHIQSKGGFRPNGCGDALEEDNDNGGTIFDICTFGKGRSEPLGCGLLVRGRL